VKARQASASSIGAERGGERGGVNGGDSTSFDAGSVDSVGCISVGSIVVDVFEGDVTVDRGAIGGKVPMKAGGVAERSDEV
jgi:hypothetical protein